MHNYPYSCNSKDYDLEKIRGLISLTAGKYPRLQQILRDLDARFEVTHVIVFTRELAYGFFDGRLYTLTSVRQDGEIPAEDEYRRRFLQEDLTQIVEALDRCESTEILSITAFVGDGAVTVVTDNDLTTALGIIASRAFLP